MKLRSATLRPGLLGLLLASSVLLKAAEPAPSPGPLAAALQPLVDRQIIAGAVALVADKEKVLALEAVGLASVKDKIPMQTDNLFWIASMSKSVTGASLMMLVDEGKLSLDDAVEKHLPEFKGQKLVPEEGGAERAPGHPITVREVMSHTSGLISAGDKRLKQKNQLAENVAQYAAAPLLREPGAKYQYNNSGINTGARVVEVLAGQPFAEFQKSRLFTPLGMKDTTYWPTEEQGSRLARTVKRTDDQKGLEDIHLDKTLTPEGIVRLSKGVKVPQLMLTNFGVGKIFEYQNQYGEPAGGLFSTAADMGTFCQMLLNGGTWKGTRYLSEKAVHEMAASQTAGVSVNPSETYGVGVSIKIKEDEGLPAGSYGHRGARKTMMWIDPQHDLALVLLVQLWELRPEDQKELYSTFLKTAVEKYGSPLRGQTKD
jgi:CubicO group peptidase (beta-lactamase class C family)